MSDFCTQCTWSILTTCSRVRRDITPFSDLLTTKIDRITPTLRRFHQDDDPQAQVLIEAILEVAHAKSHDGSESDLRWKKFLETGLHKVVVDILCEDRAYSPHKEEVRTFRWLHQLLKTLSILLGVFGWDVYTTSALRHIFNSSTV